MTNSTPTLDAPPTSPDVAPGHPAIIVTRGRLPLPGAWCWLPEQHTLVVAEALPATAVADAVAELLVALAD